MNIFAQSFIYLISVLFLLYAIFILAQGFMTNFKKIDFNPFTFFKDLIENGFSLDKLIEEEEEGGVCTFLGNDIYSERVHKGNEKVASNIEIACSKCGEYTYKGEDGCSPYQYDMRYSTRGASGTEYLGLCTSLSFPKECGDQEQIPQDQKSSSNANSVSSSFP